MSRESAGTARGRSTGPSTPAVAGLETTWDVDRVGEVTLVAGVLRSTAAVALSVRVTNRLDGPVLSPRRRGVPAAGWDDEGVQRDVPAGGRLAVGYACPAPVAGLDPPAEVEVLGPAADESLRPDEPASPEAVVRALGTARPPPDVVPAVDGMSAGRVPAPAPGELVSSLPGPRPAPRTADGGARDPSSPAAPPEVTAWLDAAAVDVEMAERLDGASVGEATAVLEAAEGLEGLPSSEAVSRRVAALREVATRAENLAARAAEVELPTDALRALAVPAGRRPG